MMNKVIILTKVIILLLISRNNLNAQAFGFSTDGNIYYSHKAGNLRIEPSFGYKNSNQTIDDKNRDIDYETINSMSTLGLGILMEKVIDSELGFSNYYGLRLSNISNKTETKQPGSSLDDSGGWETLKDESSYAGLSIAPVLGFDVLVNNRLSVGGEVQFNNYKYEYSFNEDYEGETDKLILYRIWNNGKNIC